MRLLKMRWAIERDYPAMGPSATKGRVVQLPSSRDARSRSLLQLDGRSIQVVLMISAMRSSIARGCARVFMFGGVDMKRKATWVTRHSEWVRTTVPGIQIQHAINIK